MHVLGMIFLLRTVRSLPKYVTAKEVIPSSSLLCSNSCEIRGTKEVTSQQVFPGCNHHHSFLMIQIEVSLLPLFMRRSNHAGLGLNRDKQIIPSDATYSILVSYRSCTVKSSYFANQVLVRKRLLILQQTRRDRKYYLQVMQREMHY